MDDNFEDFEPMQLCTKINYNNQIEEEVEDDDLETNRSLSKFKQTKHYY